MEVLVAVAAPIPMMAEEKRTKVISKLKRRKIASRPKDLTEKQTKMTVAVTAIRVERENRQSKDAAVLRQERTGTVQKTEVVTDRDPEIDHVTGETEGMSF